MSKKELGIRVFQLQVVEQDTKAVYEKPPLYKVVMAIVGNPTKKGKWSFVSEDEKVFDEFPIGQEFRLEAMFEQQKLEAQ